MADEQSQQLCTSCGLCCAGAIYDYVRLEPSEATGWRESGRETGGDEQNPLFTLPCPMLCGTICSIYDSRPSRCRHFRCGVLGQLEDGEIGFAEARDHVATAKMLVAGVTEFLHPGETLATARRSWLARSPADSMGLEAGRDSIGAKRLHLAMLALNLYLDRHFRKPHQAVVTEEDWPAAPPP